MEISLDRSFDDLTIEQAFWTPIVVCNLSNEEVDRTLLEETILAHRDGGGGSLIRSNRGGWHSETDMREWGGIAFTRLAERVEQIATELTLDRLDPDSAVFPWKVSAWANVNEKGSYNEQHCHPGAFWSAVFYVRVEPSAAGGEIVFRDPRSPLNEMYAPKLGLRYNGGEGTVHIKPQAGMLILTPAWLQHWVRRWDGSEPRISIALNLGVR
jgi:uncharacterized protein (TIGR02466 family)